VLHLVILLDFQLSGGVLASRGELHMREQRLSGNQQCRWFSIALEVCQHCVITLNAFVTGVDWLLQQSAGRGMNGHHFQATFIYRS